MLAAQECAPPPSQTHRALACVDLILEIIEQTSPLSDSTSDARETHRKLLATLALVCKTFNGPATKALWCRLDSFLPLMVIFSAFDHKKSSTDSPATNVCTVNPILCAIIVVTDDRKKMISGDIPPYEFSRFRELGSYVQAVGPPWTTCVCHTELIDAGSWHYLARLSPGEPLFPYLRELHWTVQDASCTELLFLVSSSLRCLTVCYSGHSADSREWTLSQGMLFRTIFDIAPHLTHLVLRDIEDKLLPACLSHARLLRGLHVTSFDHGVFIGFDTLRIMSAMEALEELSFGFDPLSEDLVDFSGFNALKTLEMTVLLTPTRLIFDAFSSPNLRKLSLNSRSEVLNHDEASAMATTLAQTFSAMEDLTWTLEIRDDVPMEAVVAPFLPLPLVRVRLEIFGVPESNLSDEFFATLPESRWSRLIELCVSVPCQPNTVAQLPGLSARTLLAFAQGCPQLRTLRLPQMHAPRLEDISGYPVLQHGLCTLSVDRLGELGDVGYVAWALVLDRLFPGLETTEPPQGHVVAGREWSRLMSGVQLCQLARINRAM